MVSSASVFVATDVTFCLDGNCCWTQDHGAYSGPDCDQDSILATVCVGDSVNFWYSGQYATQDESPSNNDNPYIVGWIEGSTAGGTPNGSNITCNPGILTSPSCPTSCNSNDRFCMPSAGSITFGQAGVYYLNALGANNASPNAPCVTTQSQYNNAKFKIKVISKPKGSIKIQDDQICEGQTTSIDHTGPNSNASLAVVGGLSGACQVSGTGTQQLTLSGCQPGNYDIEVAVSNFCGPVIRKVKLTPSMKIPKLMLGAIKRPVRGIFPFRSGGARPLAEAALLIHIPGPAQREGATLTAPR
jgi:hypothetical protein